MNIYFESQGLAGGGPGPGGRSGVYSDDDSSDDDLELGAVRLTYKDNTNDDDHLLVPGSPGARAAELAELVYFADDPDELSINRCWRKSFKGATTGRRLKRLVCRFGTYQMLFGGGLMGIAAYETITYPLDEGWFAATTYGWSVRNLTWCACRRPRIAFHLSLYGAPLTPFVFFAMFPSVFQKVCVLRVVLF